VLALLSPCSSEAQLGTRCNNKFGPPSRLAIQSKFARHGFGPFLHADETEVSIFGLFEVLWIETAPVVADEQHDFFGLEFEIDLDARGMRVFDGVGRGFLTDTQQVVLNRLVKLARCAGGGKTQLYVSAC